MLGCSHQIAAQNQLRFMRFFEEMESLPAILAYHGQAYKHLKAETLKAEDLQFAQQRLWITSFLYGLLRPLDGILPYRMEGHVELPSGENQNMFGFWKSRLTDMLIESVKGDDGILIHLATEEYQHLFDWQRVRKEVRLSFRRISEMNMAGLLNRLKTTNKCINSRNYSANNTLLIYIVPKQVI